MNRRLFLSLLLLLPFVNVLAQTEERPPIAVGAKLTFYATADGTPPITFTWYKDGAIVGTGDSYVIPSIQPYHAGIYMAKASNMAGSAESQTVSIVVIYGDGSPPPNMPANATIQRIID